MRSSPALQRRGRHVVEEIGPREAFCLVQRQVRRVHPLHDPVHTGSKRITVDAHGALGEHATHTSVHDAMGACQGNTLEIRGPQVEAHVHVYVHDHDTTTADSRRDWYPCVEQLTAKSTARWYLACCDRWMHVQEHHDMTLPGTAGGLHRMASRSAAHTDSEVK